MTATRVFLVLFSLLSLVLNIAGQICTPESTGASAVIGETSGSYTTAGTLTNVAGVHIERGATGLGKLWIVKSGATPAAYRYASAFDFTSATTPEYTMAATSGGTPGWSGTSYVATDSVGTCYFSDTSNHRVQSYLNCNTITAAVTAADGILGQTALNGNTIGTAGNQLVSPRGIAIDSKAGAVSATNPIFVASTGSHTIVKFAPAGAITATGTLVFGTFNTAGTTATDLSTPIGIDYENALDNLYVADSGNNRIQIITGAMAAAPGATTVILGATAGCTTGYSAPNSVAIDYTSTPRALYVADTGNFRVVYITAAAATSFTAAAVPTGNIFPVAATITTVTCHTAALNRNSVGATSPVDVDAVPSANAPASAGLGSIVVSDPGNSRVLKLCTGSLTVSVSLSFSMSLPFSLSVSITGTLGGPAASPSFSATFGGAGGGVSLSVSQSLSVSTGSTQAVSGAAASVAISTSSSISVAAPASASSSYSITVSLTTSITTSLTTSITTSVTVTNSYTPSVTNSVTNSYSPSVTNSNTGSYSITTSNSHSISITRSVRLCGNGVINGNEKCDEGVLNGQKSSCCRRNCRFKYGGRICSPAPNTQCFGKGRCDHFGKCSGRKIKNHKQCNVAGTVGGAKDGRCNINGVCVASA